jgi:hypothetical protein
MGRPQQGCLANPSFTLNDKNARTIWEAGKKSLDTGSLKIAANEHLRHPPYVEDKIGLQL